MADALKLPKKECHKILVFAGKGCMLKVIMSDVLFHCGKNTSHGAESEVGEFKPCLFNIGSSDVSGNGIPE